MKKITRDLKTTIQDIKSNETNTIEIEAFINHETLAIISNRFFQLSGKHITFNDVISALIVMGIRLEMSLEEVIE